MSLPPGWQFDVVIAVILATVPLLIVESWLRRHRHPLSRRRVIGLALLIIFWAFILFGSFVAPRRLAVREYSARIGDSGRHVRMAVISDLHLGPYKSGSWLAKVVESINAAQPDAVVFTGDFATTLAGLEPLDELQHLKASGGLWAIPGNHDYRIGAVDVRKRLGSFGVKMLVNRSVPLSADPGAPWLVGLDDYLYSLPDAFAATEQVPPDAPRIFAVHEPDAVHAIAGQRADLVVAGHTHGGQIRLPLVGSIAHIPTTLGRAYDRGLKEWRGMKLLITSGAGESGPRARLFCPPEIVIIDIEY